MCEPSSPRGTYSQAQLNMRQPGSRWWKAQRIAVNMLIRIRRRSDCCGNDGEPGC
jgi:hypothetical protein